MSTHGQTAVAGHKGVQVRRDLSEDGGVDSLRGHTGWFLEEGCMPGLPYV